MYQYFTENFRIGIAENILFGRKLVVYGGIVCCNWSDDETILSKVLCAW
jgi:hypothetical protein